MHAILTNNGCFYNELHHDDHMVSDLHLKKKQEILLKKIVNALESGFVLNIVRMK